MGELSRHMTDAGNDLARIASETPPEMAYFVGTGPDGQTCGNCKQFMGKVRRAGIGVGELQPGRCREFKRQMKAKCMGAVPIYNLNPDTRCCRHFEAKPPKVKKAKPGDND